MRTVAAGPLPAVPRCRSCGRSLDRNPHEGKVAFHTRRICSMSGCTGQGAILPDYPGAVKAETVTARCPRCNGPWRRVADGLCCYLCGRGVVIYEMLLSREGVN